MTELPVVYSRWCFAWRTEDFLILNEGLKASEWSYLHDKILEHELGHSVHGLSLHDVVMDLGDGFDPVFAWHSVKFAFKHPGSFLHLLPFFYHAETETLYISYVHLLLDGVFLVWALILLAIFVFIGALGGLLFSFASIVGGYLLLQGLQRLKSH